MARLVDHDKRRREILNKSIQIFSDVGYPDVTYQLIASHCGLSRTVLYKYFRTKREIFDGVIEAITTDWSAEIKSKINGFGNITYGERLCVVMEEVIDLLSRHTALLCVINEYLFSLRRSGEDVSRRVRRHTIQAKRMIGNLVRDGVETGEFVSVNIPMARDVLYGLLEAAAFQLAITDSANLVELKACARAIVQHLVAS